MEVQDIPKNLTAFIPKNLDLDKLLKEKPPTFKYQKDHFIYLIDLIYKLFNPIKLEEFGDIYSRPHSVLTQRRIRNYREHLDYLVNNGILIEDKQYIVGKKSRGFKFFNKFNTEAKQVKITNKRLIKKILTFYTLDKSKPIITSENIDINYILKWFENGKLKIDYRAAKSYLRNLYMKDANTNLTDGDDNFKKIIKYSAMQKYNARLRPLTLFHNSTFNTKIDTTAGRLHSVLTQLKSELRQFITYDNQTLVSIDIVNSQPYLASIFLNTKKFNQNNILSIIQLYNHNYSNSTQNPIMLAKLIYDAENKNDTLKYIEAVKSGLFYEKFGEQINIDTTIDNNRKIVKTALFSSIFSPNELAPHIDGVKLFNNEFPSVGRIFKKIKQGKKTHRTLACTLQNFEAKIILHSACKKLSLINPMIPIFTLHDSIITIPIYQSLVEKIMTETLTEAVGFPPKLKVEKWERVA